MEIDTFWDVIEAAQAGAATTGEPFDEVLVKQLAERPRQEILEYAERFDKLHDALYRSGPLSRRKEQRTGTR
ncbi:DUF4240 domain-containing protein [Streptomyces capitiformicae]|uniref:DUF4240 domain-containing protein n=1 Tax=Streptomyces capitiformicae TaxID=2014920 RepID=A0A919LB15_9ACTN|nr:DUF4240 domain-containing protein [Streptomyces capitiformicae]GHH89109.1 hypothetical protein GCM10017771_37580 [Streptomyces capitiformicae]